MNWRQRWQRQYYGWLLHSLGRTTFWSDKLKQRFSVLGLWAIAFWLLCLMFGANMKASMIYQLFSVLTALLLVALLVVAGRSIKEKKEVELVRVLPDFATVGVAFSYQILLRNIGSGDKYGLRISERFTPLSPTLEQFLQLREPGEEKRNWYDKKVGYYRFLWLQHWLHGARFASAVIQVLPARRNGVEATHKLEMSILPLRRGYIHFSALRVSFPEPLALAYGYQDTAAFASLLVLPKRYRIPRTLAPSSRRMYQQGGLALASHVGDSEEFNSLREYRAGDSPRHVYWPSLARNGKLLVKEFQDEHYTRQALILDNFAATELSPLFEEAVSVAAGFTANIQTGDALLDLMFVGDTSHAETMTAGRAIAHAEQMLEALANLQLCGREAFPQLQREVVQHMDRLASCVLILLQWDEPRQQLVAQLLANSVSVRVFLLVAAQAEPNLDLSVMAEHIDAFHLLHLGSVQQDLDVIDAA